MTTDNSEVKPIKTLTRKMSATAKRTLKRSPTVKKPVKATAKPSAKSPPKPVSKTAAKKPAKSPKVKVVRDSFTMPQDEYKEIGRVKNTFRKSGMPVKKSEVLRAGLKALVALDMAQMKHLLTGLEKIKTGRPKKH